MDHLKVWLLLLMAEILLTTWDVKTLQIMGEATNLNWCRISAINSSSDDLYWFIFSTRLNLWLLFSGHTYIQTSKNFQSSAFFFRVFFSGIPCDIAKDSSHFMIHPSPSPSQKPRLWRKFLTKPTGLPGLAQRRPVALGIHLFGGGSPRSPTRSREKVLWKTPGNFMGENHGRNNSIFAVVGSLFFFWQDRCASCVDRRKGFLTVGRMLWETSGWAPYLFQWGPVEK